MRLARFAAMAALPLLASTARAQSGAVAPAPVSTEATTQLDAEKTFSAALRGYRDALDRRHLETSDLRREDVGARVAEAEGLIADGRTDEAIARLAAVVESPRFELFSDSEEGTAATFRLGDALTIAGIFEPARAYFRRVLEAKDAWSGPNPVHAWARRAVDRLVDVAIETGDYAAGAQDLQSVPASAPEEIRGEISYMTGRADEASGDPEGALGAYRSVTQRCRFWAQSTYLAALIHVEHGRYKEGEDLLCSIADPKRSAETTPILADEKFFAIRDLARLGLGRIAHEEGRNDDARYYYYLVPQDSDRLAEALYEAATTRYEKKDYDGARELLDELRASGLHHRYEDEAQVLDAWVDLARCRFADADRKLREFLAHYQPVRDAARALAGNEIATHILVAAIDTGNASDVTVPGATPDVVAAIAAIVRMDPTYDRVLRRRSVLEREASGLVGALGAVGDMERTLATNGGVRPALDQAPNSGGRDAQVREALVGLEQQIGQLETAQAPPDRVSPLRARLEFLQQEASAADVGSDRTAATEQTSGADLGDLLRRDASSGAGLQSRIETVRRALDLEELGLAHDALRRLDLRLSRLIRRARLGRIESVLGRKRALEVEIEAIRLGYLPQDAVDSLDAARYLEDGEEYWPFEGDDWPDEYVGGETK